MSDADDALAALRRATTPHAPERRVRSLVDDAHARIRDLADAARLAGRADVLVDEHPSDRTRAAADDADRRAVLAAEVAHGAVDALVRGQR